MNIALCIEKLLPAAKYGGSVTANTKEAYDKIRWEDERKKPSWEELVSVSKSVENDIQEEKELWEAEEKVSEEIRNAAIDSLHQKGKINTPMMIKLKSKK